MRTLSLVLVMACSSNGGGGGGGDDDTGIDAPTGASEACEMTIAQYCSNVQCDGTPAAAEQDATLCPSNEVSCLDVDIVVSTTPDVGVNLYYQNGALVAIEDISILGVRCVAGPATFAPFSCGSTQGTPLPVCAHSAR